MSFAQMQQQQKLWSKLHFPQNYLAPEHRDIPDNPVKNPFHSLLRSEKGKSNSFDITANGMNSCRNHAD